MDYLIFLVLEPAEQVSNSLSKSPISTVLPYARALYDQLYSMPLAERAVDAVRTKLIEGIERRFLGLKEERLERKQKNNNIFLQNLLPFDTTRSTVQGSDLATKC